MELIRPGDAGYDRLRAVFDHRVDRRPAAIARCRSSDDVRVALDFAASHELPYAVRGGAASTSARDPQRAIAAGRASERPSNTARRRS